MTAADVNVREVGPRDGLQLVQKFFPTAEKCRWIEMEAAAGVSVIEVTSLVPPKIGPQFIDSAEVVARAKTILGLQTMGLVPNLKGAQRGVELGLGALNFVMSVSKTHNLKNVRREREESIAELGQIVALLNTLPLSERPRLVAGLSTALGCSYEGRIPVDDVVHYAAMLAELGADEIVVADTVGYGDPAHVKKVFTAVMREVGSIPLIAHFHDTRATGLANVAAALDCGVRDFDASLAGLGGCPFAPGASGNIAMEDLCFMLESMGLRTNVDLEKLLKVRSILEQHLPAGELRGAIAKAGLPNKFPWPV